MKNTRLKIDNFLENKLENQSMFIGGGDRTLEAPLDGESGGSSGPSGSGGSTVSTGNGGGEAGPGGNGNLTPTFPPELPLMP